MIAVDQRIWSIQIMLCAALLGGMAASSSRAQVASREAAGFGPLERIVVTGRRTEATPLGIPAALNVLGDARLEHAQIRSTFDVQFAVPGLVTTANTAFGQLYMRGVGSDLISVGGDATVSTFIDGVYQARAAASLQDVFDVARIEVLKGPQGALYGRNTTAGAVHVVSNLPSLTPGASGSVDVGNHRQRRVEGVLNGPIVPDAAAIRLAVMANKNRGFARNTARNEVTDASNVAAARLQALIMPTDAVEVVLRADVSDNDSSRFLAPKLVAPLADSAAAPFTGPPSPDPRIVSLDTTPRIDLRSGGGSADVTWRYGADTFRSLIAWREHRLNQVIDLDATQLPFATGGDIERSRVFTQDVQWSRLGDDWSVLVGGSYLHEKVFQSLDLFTPVLRTRDQPEAHIVGDAISVFAQGMWQFAEDWSTIGALRYSDDNKRERFRQILNLAPAAAFISRASWDAVSPEFTLDYRPADDWLLYASLKRGFKAGGFNANQAQPAPFAPERLWATEAGAKGRVGGTAELAASLFHYDYRDIQVTRIVPSAAGGALVTIENAAAAEINGAEVSAVVAPLDALSIDGALAYLDATYDRYVTINPSAPTQNPDRAGNRLPKAPEWTFNVGATATVEIAPALEASARIEYRRQSAMFLNAFEDPFMRQEAYGLLNASVAVGDPEGRWSLAFYGRNLDDTLYAVGASRLRGQTGNLRIWGAPREYGLELGFKY